MGNATSDWEEELKRWLKPFLDRLGHKARRRMCPLYVGGLIGPGERKSIQPMAERFAAGDYWRGLHRHTLMTMIAYAFLQHRRLTQVG